MARFCSLLSGGKDSNYALYRALREGIEPACILSIRPHRVDSWMFHTAVLEAPRYQARAMGLENVFREHAVSGEKEVEVQELYRVLSQLHREIGFDVLVVGAIASTYQRRRVELIAGKLGLRVFAPQWGEDPRRYMRSLVEEGFKFVLVRASTMGLDERHVGVIVDNSLLEDILERASKYSFHPAFEGGEAETLVLSAPHYKSSLCIEGSRVSRPGGVFELEVSMIYLCSEPQVRIYQAGEEPLEPSQDGLRVG
ncbi:MAG: diphthine--ammonia ligase [Aeropyrum sp.]|nr:diphthine--ammonia ligase [Aeropyrum sp.]